MKSQENPVTSKASVSSGTVETIGEKAKRALESRAGKINNFVLEKRNKLIPKIESEIRQLIQDLPRKVHRASGKGEGSFSRDIVRVPTYTVRSVFPWEELIPGTSGIIDSEIISKLPAFEELKNKCDKEGLTVEVDNFYVRDGGVFVYFITISW